MKEKKFFTLPNLIIGTALVLGLPAPYGGIIVGIYFVLRYQKFYGKKG